MTLSTYLLAAAESIRTGREASREIVAGTYKHQKEVDALLKEEGLERSYLLGKSFWAFLGGARAHGDRAPTPLCDLCVTAPRCSVL